MWSSLMFLRRCAVHSQRGSSLKPVWQTRTAKVGISLACAGLAAFAYRPSRDAINTLVVAAVRFSRSCTAAALILNDYRKTLAEIKSRGLHGDSAKLQRSQCHQRSADRLLALFRKNGGVYVKAGQHMAALYVLLPSEYVTTMAVLQDAAPYRPFKEVRTVLEQDLGKPFSEVFESIEETPIASASLAQVHVGILKDGKRKVAVKIQYPGLREMSRSDLATISILCRAAKWAFPDFSFMWLEHEFRVNLPKELDFKSEAANNERVKELFADSELPLHLPKVYWPFTSHRVLVMEFCEGVKVNQRDKLEAMGVSPDRVVEILARVFGEMVFVHGYVHCDPHPGNVLARRNSAGQTQIVLLDHGLYRDLDRDFRINYAHLWRSLILRDFEGIKIFSKRLGVDKYKLFSTMLTARSWENSSVAFDTPRTAEELRRLKAGAAMQFKNINEVLSSVPRPLLLLFKTNDLLRSINNALGTAINPNIVMVEYVMRALREESLVQFPGLRGRWRAWKAEWHIWLLLSVYTIVLRLGRVAQVVGAIFSNLGKKQHLL